MDKYVKMCIDSREKTFYDYYEVNDKNIKKEIDEFIKDMNTLGNSVSDSTEFETKFASSELSNRYMNLLTKVSTNCKMKDAVDEEDNDKNEVLEDSKRFAKRMVSMEANRQMRRIPIVGDVMRAKQHVDLFSKIKGKIKK